MEYLQRCGWAVAGPSEVYIKHCGPFSDIGHCFDTRPTPRRHSDTGGTPLKILCSEPLLFITDYWRKLDVAGSRLTGLP